MQGDLSTKKLLCLNKGQKKLHQKIVLENITLVYFLPYLPPSPTKMNSILIIICNVPIK